MLLSSRFNCVLRCALCCVLGCSARLEAQECDRLLDAYSEKLLLSVNPQLSPAQLLKLQQRVRDLAHETPDYDFAGCMKRIRREQFNCAMSAADVDGIERCLML